MSKKYENIYGKEIMNDFRKKALIPQITDVVSGREIINVSYGHVAQEKSKENKSSYSKKVSKPKTVKNKNSSGTGIGQYAKSIFSNLLNSNKLNDEQLSNLMDKNYCSKELGISYPVIVEYDSENYDSSRYYKKDIILGKYLICSQWYERNKIKINDWLLLNGLKEKD